jgi:hypothetical protein
MFLIGMAMARQKCLLRNREFAGGRRRDVPRWGTILGVSSFHNIINETVANLRTKMRNNLSILTAVFFVKLFIFHGYRGKPVGPLFSYTSFQKLKSDQLSENLPCVFSNIASRTSKFAIFIFCFGRSVYKPLKFIDIRS